MREYEPRDYEGEVSLYYIVNYIKLMDREHEARLEASAISC